MKTSTRIVKYELQLVKSNLENVTKVYNTTARSKINRINVEAKNIVTKLGIQDRVEQLSERNAYITVKDHKEEFPEKISFRLINPSKSEIGKSVQSYLTNLIKRLQNQLSLISGKIQILSSNGLRVSKIKEKLLSLYLTSKVFTLLYHQSYSTRVWTLQNPCKIYLIMISI